MRVSITQLLLVVISGIPIWRATADDSGIPLSEAPSSSFVPSASYGPTISSYPSEIPSSIPSAPPSDAPSANPSVAPSSNPSATPSDGPSLSAKPSMTPSVSTSPSSNPSVSTSPSSLPSDKPSATPTISQEPSDLPSVSKVPSTNPSSPPTSAPTGTPTSSPNPTGYSENIYYDIPELKWSTQVRRIGAATIGSGNAVQISPDNLLVYTTLSDGRLEVMKASNGQRFSTFNPTTITGRSIVCESGISFGTLANVGDYAVYAILFTNGVIQEDTSRVVAVTHPGNKLLWESDFIPGRIQGTPIISKNGDATRNPGRYVFFTHNQVVDGSWVGTFSILQADLNGGLVFSEMAGESSTDPQPENFEFVNTLRLPYGPLGVAHTPDQGRYPAGQNRTSDLLVWSTSDGDGRNDNGYTRAFQFHKDFQPAFIATQETTLLRFVDWNAIAGPVLTENGQKLVFGVRGNGIRGWTDSDFNWLGNMGQQLVQRPNDLRYPVEYTPAYSKSEEFIFAVSSEPYLYGMDGITGEVYWIFNDIAPYVASPKVSPNEYYVYVITTNGLVTAHWQANGNLAWSVKCSDFELTSEDGCVDDVAADFTVSENGLVLFYADRLGNIRALQLGQSKVGTLSPTEFPTAAPTKAPTSSPSKSPTMEPTITPEPSTTLSETPSASPSGTPSFIPTAIPSKTPVLDTPVDNPTLFPTPSPPSARSNIDAVQQGSGAVSITTTARSGVAHFLLSSLLLATTSMLLFV